MNPRRCDRCHRPLTVTVGGLGPVCARRENPTVAVPVAHRSPVVPRRRVPAIPGQIPLELQPDNQENP